MIPIELLSEKENDFYEKLESKSLKEIDLDNFEHLKNIVDGYNYNISSIKRNYEKSDLLKKLLFKFSREATDVLKFHISSICNIPGIISPSNIIDPLCNSFTNTWDSIDIWNFIACLNGNK